MPEIWLWLKNPVNWPAMITAFAAAVAAMATIIYTYYSRRLRQATKESMEISRKEFEAARRPFVGVLGIDRDDPAGFECIPASRVWER